jgi:serine/threonine protein kinase
MTPERWKAIDRIFSTAAALPPAKRPEYLEEACRDNPTLRQEVESLLAEHNRPGPFLGVYSSVGDKILAHYQVLERIGEGGMGLVYKALDTTLHRVVAIKVLPPWLMGDTHSRQRLLEEARSASALNHPNVVTVHAIAEHNGIDFIVMEYVTGPTLYDLIPSRGLPVERALNFARQIGSALSAAHAAGIVHGDLKPRNIIVTDNDHLKLVDFGVARRIGESMPKFEFVTKEYAAPEQHKGVLDVRSEVFTFGLILHAMLCGQHAFGPGTQDEIKAAIRTKEPNPPRPKVPTALAEIVKRCLEKAPERRFQSIREVVDALTEGSKAPVRRNHSRVVNLDQTISKEVARSLPQLRSEIRRIGYQSLADSRRAFADIARQLEKTRSAAVRQAVISAMRDLIVINPESDGGIVTSSSREVRKLALELINLATHDDLKSCFEEEDLQRLDLYGMDFAGKQLPSMNFSGSFLVEANFRESNLVHAEFAGAYIRNVNFAKANLSEADFTDADWFNALFLTQDQLAQVREDTLMDCPATVAEMHKYLEKHYALPFESWSGRVGDQLTATWNEYLQPGGLRHFVAAQRRRSSH